MPYEKPIPDISLIQSTNNDNTILSNNKSLIFHAVTIMSILILAIFRIEFSFLSPSLLIMIKYIACRVQSNVLFHYLKFQNCCGITLCHYARHRKLLTLCSKCRICQFPWFNTLYHIIPEHIKIAIMYFSNFVVYILCCYNQLFYLHMMHEQLVRMNDNTSKKI